MNHCRYERQIKDAEYLTADGCAHLLAAEPHLLHDLIALPVVIALGYLLVVHNQHGRHDKQKSQKDTQKQQAAVSLALAAAGCAVLHMETESLSLEDVFLQLTEFDSPEEDPPESPEADEDGYEDDEVEPDEEEGGPQP